MIVGYMWQVLRGGTFFLHPIRGQPQKGPSWIELREGSILDYHFWLSMACSVLCAGVPCWFFDHQYLWKQSVDSFFWPFPVLFLVIVSYLLSNYCVCLLLFICFYFYFASNVNIADKIFVSSFCNFNNNGDW